MVFVTVDFQPLTHTRRVTTDSHCWPLHSVTEWVITLKKPCMCFVVGITESVAVQGMDLSFH